VTEIPVADKNVSNTDLSLAKTWLKISLNNQELGYIPKIYVTPNTKVVPILDPPTCT